MSEPPQFYIDVWNRCNNQCVHCFNKGGLTSGPMLSTLELFRIIDEVHYFFDLQEIHLTGGEPTLRWDILHIMQTLLKQNLKIFLHTNGMFEKEIALKLHQLPADRVTLIIALDGIKANDYFRGKGAAKTVIRNIERLSKTFPIQLDILLTSRLKWDEIEILAQLATQHHLTLSFNPLYPIGRANASHMMPARDYFDLMLRLEEFLPKRIGIKKCFHLQNGQLHENSDCSVRSTHNIYISADGSLYCGSLPVSQWTDYVGNMRDSSLKDLFQHHPLTAKTLPLLCQQCEFQKNGYCHGRCTAGFYGKYKSVGVMDFYCMANYYKTKG